MNNLVIWRFPVKITDRTVLQMPAGSRTLTVGPYRQAPQYAVLVYDQPLDMWALVDTAQPEVDREFMIVGTGSPVPADAVNYVGTTHSDGGDLIWHVFESSRTFTAGMRTIVPIGGTT